MPEPLRIRWFQSVRLRLLVIALLPILVITPLFVGGVVLNWSTRFDKLLIAKVNGELTIAHQYLARLKERAGENLHALGDSVAFAEATQSTLHVFLESRRQRYGFDFLYVIDESGNVMSATSHEAPPNAQDWPVVQSAMDGVIRTEIDIFTQKDLLEISTGLAERAQIDLVATKAALPTQRAEESRGMVIHTAAPLGSGGVLVGGVLLNQNLDFIDTINGLVYPAASLTEGSRGTTTLFLEDVRISTNVRLFENIRALGTKVSVVVREAVLDEGRVWLDRAFVVNDWYISAYEPIVDSFGQRVGMLYVGFLDSPFRAAKTRTILVIGAGFILLLALSVPVFLRLAHGIFRPLETMVSTIAKVERGDLSARSGLGKGQHEIALVSNQLDTLLEQVQERNRQLQEWGDSLNTRVEERTVELREANKRLETTNQQLIVAEKLATIGEITASIAHEINNPIAVIQGNMDVIRQELGASAAPLETELALVDAQVHSINVLVNKLLQFARPEEYAGVIDYTLPNEVIRDTLPLVQHLLNKVYIDLELELESDRAIVMNRIELQQVLINLIVNAIHAMPEGGKLRIGTENLKLDGNEGIMITVSDTGIGMSEAVIKRVFDPFFTTKSTEGTGLGLSISQKLVTRSDGQIRVESTPGKGTLFLLFFKAAQET